MIDCSRAAIFAATLASASLLFVVPSLAQPGGATHRVAAHESSGVVLINDDDRSSRRHRRHYRTTRDDDGEVVDAPYTHVEAGRRVVVDAPFAHVGVHNGDGVHVRAPFVNLWVPR